MSSGGGGGGGGLSKLGIALTIIFAVSLVALLAEIFYVLWRRRLFRRQTNSTGRDGAVTDEVSEYSSSESSSTLSFPSVTASKELLYFFCVRSSSQPSSINAAATSSDGLNLGSARRSDAEAIDIDLLAIQGMFGPPRFLFTIKEEEREDVQDSPVGKYACGYDDRKEVKKNKVEDENRSAVTSVSLEECFKAVDDDDVVAVQIDTDDVAATPFETPCASPVYFTPTGSPVHDVVPSGRSPGEDVHQTATFVGRERGNYSSKQVPPNEN